MATKRACLTFVWLILLVVAPGCRRKSDALLQKRLVGTWSYGWSEGAGTALPSDLTFTVTTNGNYFSQISIPQVHVIQGRAQIEDGFLVLTGTNRDNISVYPPLIEHQTIVQLNDSELVVVSENSTVTNHFLKQWPAGR